MYAGKKWYMHNSKKDWEWDRVVPYGGGKYPVIIGEFVNESEKENLEEKVLDFAAEDDLPWIPWSLHPDAKSCLIKDWNFTPTSYSQHVKDVLQKAAARL